MSSPTPSSRFALGALAVVLLALPLTLAKPGLPPNLKADEAAYLMMASSLAHDHDLKVGVEDIDRLFAEFHYLPTNNVVLATTDHWQTVTFGKPWVYSAIAAPLVRAFGSNGMLALNMLLLVGMIWAGAARLAKRDPTGPTLPFAAAFFLLSNVWAYVFWLQPEVFMAASAFFATLLAERAGRGETGRRAALLAAAGAATLALGVYHKPMLAAFALPALIAAWRGPRRTAALSGWVGGFVGCLLVITAVSWSMTGTVSAYLGVVRQGVTICEPGRLPLDDVAQVIAPTPASGTPATTAESEIVPTQLPATPTAAPTTELAERPAETPPEIPAETPAAPSLGTSVATTASPTGGSWTWIFRLPPLEPRAFLDSLSSFLWGRHTGMLPYTPFGLLAIGLFWGSRRRDPISWGILAAVGAVGLFTLLFIPFNWHGGGGFIGNRYFVIAYPALLLLVPRVPRWAMVLGTLVGGLFLSSILFAPFGAPVPEPTLQAHVRSWPFRLLPVEVQLRNVPGYHGQSTGGSFVLARREQVLPRGEMFWLEGNARVELEVASAGPEHDLAVLARSFAPANTVVVSLEGDRHELLLGEGEARRIDFHGDSGRRVDRTGGEVQWWRLLEVSTSAGASRLWQRHFPPRRCPDFGWNESAEENFWVGAELVLLGRPAEIDADVFHLEWRRLLAPSELTVGDHATARVRVVNTSTAPWPAPDTALGAARVKAAPRWIDEDGAALEWDAPRVELPHTVVPGAELIIDLPITSPPTPGTWTLEVDWVFEHVGWFSQQAVPTRRTRVQVVAPAAPSAAESAGDQPMPTG